MRRQSEKRFAAASFWMVLAGCTFLILATTPVWGAAQGEPGIYVVRENGATLYVRKGLAEPKPHKLPRSLRNPFPKETQVPQHVVLKLGLTGDQPGFGKVLSAPLSLGAWASAIADPSCRQEFFVRWTRAERVPNLFLWGSQLKKKAHQMRASYVDLVHGTEGDEVKLTYKDIYALGFQRRRGGRWEVLVTMAKPTRKPPSFGYWVRASDVVGHSEDRPAGPAKETVTPAARPAEGVTRTGEAHSLKRAANRAIGEAEKLRADVGPGKCAAGDAALAKAKRLTDQDDHRAAKESAEMAADAYRTYGGEVEEQAASDAIADAENMQKKVGKGSVTTADGMLDSAKRKFRNKDYASARKDAKLAAKAYGDGMKEPVQKLISEADELQRKILRGKVQDADKALVKARAAFDDGKYAQAAEWAQQAKEGYEQELQKAKKGAAEERIDRATKLQKQIGANRARASDHALAKARAAMAQHDYTAAAQQAEAAIEGYRDAILKDERLMAETALREAEDLQNEVGAGKVAVADDALRNVRDALGQKSYLMARQLADRAKSAYRKHKAKALIREVQELQQTIGQGVVKGADIKLAQAKKQMGQELYGGAMEAASLAKQYYQEHLSKVKDARKRFQEAFARAKDRRSLIAAYHWPRLTDASKLDAFAHEVKLSYRLDLIEQRHADVQRLKDKLEQHAQQQVVEARARLGDCQSMAKQCERLRRLGEQLSLSVLAVSAEEINFALNPSRKTAAELLASWETGGKPDRAFDFDYIGGLGERLKRGIGSYRDKCIKRLMTQHAEVERQVERAATTKEGIFGESGPHADAQRKARDSLVSSARDALGNTKRTISKLKEDTDWSSWTRAVLDEIREGWAKAAARAGLVLENRRSGPNFSPEGATVVRLRRGDKLVITGRISRESGDRRDFWLIGPAAPNALPIRIKLTKFSGRAGDGDNQAWCRGPKDKEWAQFTSRVLSADGEVSILFDGTAQYVFEAVAAQGDGRKAVPLNESWDRKLGPPKAPF